MRVNREISQLIPMLKYHLISLVGLAFTLFGIVKFLAPPVILDDPSISILDGYKGHDCGYGTFSDSYRSSCLSSVNGENNSVENVKTFYTKQMLDLGWREIPNSRHENPIAGEYTAFFLDKTLGGCQTERAIMVNQNTYRGGVKLEDITIQFNEYLVGCERAFPYALDTLREPVSSGTEG